MTAEDPTPIKKKRKGAKAKRAQAGYQREPLDASGLERPRFLLNFPSNPELEELIVAFEAGNYRLVRKQAEELAGRTADPAVREAALELRRRVDMDPLVKYLWLISVALLVFLTVYAYTR
ncbi:MAG TPA: hypothetical protein VGJ84_19375 [Polyangiaceae bacterium]|jgi:hypothetical protein